MTSLSIAERAVELVRGDAILRKSIAAAMPQSVVMPFARERQKNYLMIAVFVTDESLNRDALAFICRRIIEVLKSAKVLRDLEGLEIVPCVVLNGRTERILRLSILSHALDQAEHLESTDIVLPNPREDITCILYKKGLEI